MSIYRTRRTLKPPGMDPDKAVGRAVLDEILEDAHWAPTHGLTQPWRFHVFASASGREALAGMLLEVHDLDTPEARRNPEKRDKLIAAVTRAPVVIALVAKVEPAGKIAEWEEIAAVSCAAQNLMLSAHEKGLGSFWSSAPTACSPAFVKRLGHDATHRSLGLLMLGYPADPEHPPKSVRAPLAERVIRHD